MRIGIGKLYRGIGRTEPVVSFGPGGVTRIIANLNTPLGLKLFRYGHWDESLQYTWSILSPDDIFLDCGANIGLFSLVAAEKVGPGGLVLSFEPVPETMSALRKNVALNGFSWVQTHPIALGETTGNAELVAMPGGGGLSSFAPANPQEGERTRVPVRRLDDIVDAAWFSRIRLVKIDVEGAEYSLLRGARRLMAESQCDVIIELESAHLARQGASVETVTRTLEEVGLRRASVMLEPPNVLFTRC